MTLRTSVSALNHQHHGERLWTRKATRRREDCEDEKRQREERPERRIELTREEQVQALLILSKHDTRRTYTAHRLFPFALDYPEVSLPPPVEHQWGNTKPASFYYLGWLITWDEKRHLLGKMDTSWGRTNSNIGLIQVLMSELGISQAQLLVSFSSIIGSRCILRKNMEKALSRKRYGLLDYPNETISNGTRFLGRGFHCFTSCIRFNLSIPVARSFESGYVRIWFQQLSGFEYHKSREEVMFFNV
ncbi:hypothetical protein EV361DRAFT_872152 [Lentinula raphanica]|nr:hypothetical protein EV361DRAFT_872152 [Lentinula raphanica]